MKAIMILAVLLAIIGIGAAIDNQSASSISQTAYKSFVTDNSMLANIQISSDVDENAVNIVILAKSGSDYDVTVARMAGIMVYDAVQKGFPEVERGFLHIQYAGNEDYVIVTIPDLLNARSNDGAVDGIEALDIMAKLLDEGITHERMGMFKESYAGPTSSWAGTGQGAKPGMEEDNDFNYVSPSEFPTNADTQVISSASSGQLVSQQPVISEASSSASEAPTPVVSGNPGTGEFVGSKESNKYHYPSCRWVEKILPENKIWFASSEDARAQGYEPCGTCHPP